MILNSRIKLLRKYSQTRLVRPPLKSSDPFSSLVPSETIIRVSRSYLILFYPIFWQNPILWEMSYFILFFGHFAFNFGIL